MKVALALGCAAACLAATGCLDRVFLASSAEQAKYSRAVDAVPSQVELALQMALSEAGTLVLAKRQPNEVRLVGQTKSGEVICVRVRPVQVAGKSQSVVSVQWGRHPDEQLWQVITEALADFAPAEGGAP
jgi:hypothetical protein